MLLNVKAPILALTAAAGVVIPGVAAPASTAGAVGRADLRADVDRNGFIDAAGSSDERGEDTWTMQRGAIVLPNLDDDARRCPVKDGKGKPLPLAKIAGCNDAADTVVNGAKDAADLARLRTVALPRASAKATGTLTLTGGGARYGRFFIKRGNGWRAVRPADRLDAGQLRRGVELGLEATDVVRDPRRWNGLLTVRLTVADRGRATADTVVARVAPMLTHHHLQRAERVMVVAFPGREDRKFVAELSKHARAAGIAAPLLTMAPESGDPWTQDFVEPSYVSMPGPARHPQTMRIMLASPQDRYTLPLWGLRGPGVGVVQIAQAKESEEYTLSSMGNLETIPPYRRGTKSYPAGRIVMGQRPDTGNKPAKSLRDFLAAQGAQDPLLLDVSWLYIGHVDEFLQFLPARTPRGWRLAVADPAAGLALLRKLQAQGHGGRPILSAPPLPPAGPGLPNRPHPTIDQALAQRALLDANALANRKITENVATLKRETGLTDAEIVHVPGLYAFDKSSGTTSGTTGGKPKGLRKLGQQAFVGKGGTGKPLPTGLKTAPRTRTSAYIPGAINNVLLAPDRILAARQWGPMINGKDVFAQAVTAAYAHAGIKTGYIDDWNTYHMMTGEVHCATNVLRNTTTPWWRN